MWSTDWKKPAIASRPLYSVGNPNVARYGSSKAPSSANISAAFFGSLNEKAVYSSMSSLAFFIDILLFLTIISPNGLEGSRLQTGASGATLGLSLSAPGLWLDLRGSMKQIHHEELEDSDRERPSAFPKIVLVQTDSGIQQLHGAGERTQEQQRKGRLLVDRPQYQQSQRNSGRRRVQCQQQRRLVRNGGRDQVLRTDDRRDGKAARDQDIDCRDQRSQPNRLFCCHRFLPLSKLVPV